MTLCNGLNGVGRNDGTKSAEDGRYFISVKGVNGFDDIICINLYFIS